MCIPRIMHGDGGAVCVVGINIVIILNGFSVARIGTNECQGLRGRKNGEDKKKSDNITQSLYYVIGLEKPFTQSFRLKIRWQ